MPILSVIVPTHNRSHYAVATINSILSIPGDVEVVVSDSSAVDEISAQVVNANWGNRLKIVRSDRPISVVENFNMALAAASGEYLVFIGDDDFVSSDVVRLAEWAKERSIDALKLNFAAWYYWPDFMHAGRGNSYGGTLHVSPFTGKVVAHEARKALEYALSNFGGGVFEMPRAYAGMLSADLARKIIVKYGSLFGGVSPDIYSSALIACEARNCVSVDFPVVIPGSSGQSTAGQSASGGHRGKLRENSHIAAFSDLVWDERIPEFYSVPTVWSFSLLKAVEALAGKGGVDGLSPSFGRLIVKCLAYHPDQTAHTLKTLRHLGKRYGRIRIMLQMLSGVFGEGVWGVSRITNRVRARYVKRNVQVFDGLATTLAAREMLENHIASQNVFLSL